MEGVKSCSIKTEMIGALKELSNNGIKQSILSATDQENLNYMIDHFGIGNYFEKVFGLSNKEATCKIDRGGVLIDSISGYNKDELLIVGDTLHDLEVGKAHGVDVLLVAHGHNSVERLRAEHGMVLEV